MTSGRERLTAALAALVLLVGVVAAVAQGGDGDGSGPRVTQPTTDPAAAAEAERQAAAERAAVARWQAGVRQVGGSVHRVVQPMSSAFASYGVGEPTLASASFVREDVLRRGAVPAALRPQRARLAALRAPASRAPARRSLLAALDGLVAATARAEAAATVAQRTAARSALGTATATWRTRLLAAVGGTLVTPGEAEADTESQTSRAAYLLALGKVCQLSLERLAGAGDSMGGRDNQVLLQISTAFSSGATGASEVLAPPSAAANRLQDALGPLINGYGVIVQAYTKRLAGTTSDAEFGPELGAGLREVNPALPEAEAAFRGVGSQVCASLFSG